MKISEATEIRNDFFQCECFMQTNAHIEIDTDPHACIHTYTYTRTAYSFVASAFRSIYYVCCWHGCASAFLRVFGPFLIS